LVDACKDADGVTRVRAAAALVKAGSDKAAALTVLKTALKDKDAPVRVAAAGALWEFDPSKDALLVLVAALEDKDDEVCCDAGVILGKIGPGAKAIVPDLLRLLKDKFAPYYDPAAEALKKIDPEAAKKTGVP
jgi:HEAT repeat protein